MNGCRVHNPSEPHGPAKPSSLARTVVPRHRPERAFPPTYVFVRYARACARPLLDAPSWAFYEAGGDHVPLSIRWKPAPDNHRATIANRLAGSTASPSAAGSASATSRTLNNGSDNGGSFRWSSSQSFMALDSAPRCGLGAGSVLTTAAGCAFHPGSGKIGPGGWRARACANACLTRFTRSRRSISSSETMRC